MDSKQQSRIRLRRLSTLLAICVIALFVLTVLVETGGVSSLDRSLEVRVHADMSSGVYGLMAELSVWGQTDTLGVFAVVTAVAAYGLQARWAAVFIPVSAFGSSLLDELMKVLVQRDRPHLWHTATVIHSYSFPSGHATLSSAFFAALVYAVWAHFGSVAGRNLLIPACALVGAIGFSRIYLGVHWPSDVVAGFALGVGWAALVAIVFRFLPVRRAPL